MMKFLNKTRLVLFPFSLIYYTLYKIDIYIKKKHIKKIPDSFVISIGNITTGGTGKTPFVIYLAKKLKKYNPVILTRGYKSNIKEKLFKYSNKTNKIYGDEPTLISKETGCYVSINKDRFKAGIKAKKISSFFILDDGFQHKQLHRDIDIIIIDATNPFGNNILLPAGNLREPVKTIKNADFIFINKISMISKNKKEKILKKLIEKYKINKEKIFLSDYKKEGIFKNSKKISPENLKNKKILAFAGIGNFNSFEKNIATLLPGQDIKFIKFSDHYNYTKKDIYLFKKYIKKGYILITTEKDVIKIKNINKTIYYLKISTQIYNEEKFINTLKKLLRRRGKRRSRN